MDEWLSSHPPLWQPRVLQVFGSWVRTWHQSSGYAEAASHMPQLDALTVKIYNYVLGGFREKKKKKEKKKMSTGY